MAKKKETVHETIARWVSEDKWLPFSWWLFDLAELIVCGAMQLVQMDMPTAYFGDDPVGGGKGKEDPSAIDILTVIHGADFLRYQPIMMQTVGFLEWLQNEEFKFADENENGRWLGEKWNEYAAMRKSEQQNYDATDAKDLFGRFFHDQ